MKPLRDSVLVFAVIAVTWTMFHWHQVKRQLVDAQETIQQNEKDAGTKDNSSEKDVIRLKGTRPFPALFVNDVVSVLKAEVERLIETKSARNSDELRKNLDRTEFTTKLPRPRTKELSQPEHYKQATESVFLVAGLTKPTEEDSSWQTSFSTAFVIHEDGILCTSAHVFDHDDHDDAVIVLDSKGAVIPVVELLAVDRKGDTCLFRIAKKGLKPIPLGDEILPGSPVRVMGHPGDSFFFFSTGNIANYETDEDGLVWLNVTADFGQGSSGGPVMDGMGNVVGQVSRTYTLYASGDSSSRHRRRDVRQVSDDGRNDGSNVAKIPGNKDDQKPENEEMQYPEKKDETEDKNASKKASDPQMVFKACTPVSAIRALIK